MIRTVLAKRARWLARLVAIAVPVAGAGAQGIDLTQGGPIQITARDGIEWRQADQVVIANGDAKAVRANVTVTADRLIAWYRKKETPNRPPMSQQPATQPVPAPAANGAAGSTETEGNEVYRLRAEGNVHIFTATDQAWGDQATYDLDQAVLVMTGRALKLASPDNTLTARDTLEYWSRKHMSVARGDAVVVTSDARRVAADVLVAVMVDAPAVPAGAAQGGVPARGAQGGVPAGGAQGGVPVGGQGAAPVAARPAAAGGSAAGDSTAAMAGKLERVEAFNNVSVRTQTEIVTGDRGVYIPDTGIARLGGHVRITRGPNQVNGNEAVVNMKTGIATLLAGGGGRVSGLVMPGDRSTGAALTAGAPDKTAPAKPAPAPAAGTAPVQPPAAQSSAAQPQVLAQPPVQTGAPLSLAPPGSTGPDTRARGSAASGPATSGTRQ